MGLPSRSAVCAKDITIEGLELRFKACLGDGRVFVSCSGSDLPLVAEVDRIGAAILLPRIEVIDSDVIPGLLEVRDAVNAAAVAFYRQHYPVPLSTTIRVRPVPHPTEEVR